MKYLLFAAFVFEILVLAACGPTPEQKEKIVVALEANTVAQRAAAVAEESLTSWWGVQEPDSTAAEWLSFVWESTSDTKNRKLVHQAQERVTLSRGNAAAARDNAARAWEEAQNIWVTEGYVRGAAESEERTADMMHEMGNSKWTEKYGESLQTTRRANELEANAEALELIGTAYTLSAQAFDAEANAWMALAVWAE